MIIYPFFYETEQEFLKKQEIKEIRKAGNITGLIFLILSAIMVFWSFPIEIIALKIQDLGFNTQPLMDFIYYDTTFKQVIQITVSSIAFIFPFLLFLKMMKVRISDVGFFEPAKNKKLVFPFVLVGLGICGYSNFITSAAGSLFETFGFSYNVQQSQNPNNLFGIILSFVATAVTPALVEEFAMRGALMGTLRKYGDAFAVVISAVVFGLMHGNLIQIPFAFILGLFFGYAVIKTGSIWTAVIIHFLNNLFSLSLDYISSGLNGIMVWVLNYLYLLVLLLVGIVGYYLLVRKNGHDFKLNNQKGLLTPPKKLKKFLTAPCMILVYVTVVFESFFIYAV